MTLQAAAEVAFVVKKSPKQAEAWQWLARPETNALWLRGSKGSGKTAAAIQWCVDRCLDLIEEFNIPPQADPIQVGFIGRRFATDFEISTLKRWQELVPSALYEMRGGDKFIILDRLQIDCGGISRVDNASGAGKRNKFQGIPYVFFFVDQAEDLTQDEASFLIATLNRPNSKFDNITIPGKEIWASNPPDGWLKPRFSSSAQGRKTINFIPEDNPWLDVPAYLAQLESAYGHNRPLYDAYRWGTDNIGAVNSCIRSEWIDRAMTISPLGKPRIFLAVDPAWEGDDRTVVYTMDRTDIIAEEIWGGTTQPETERRIHVIAERNGRCPIVIDSTGTCGGIGEHLAEMGNRVSMINFASASSNDNLANMRAELWWMAAQDFQRGNVALRQCDEELRAELQQPRIDIRNGKILIEDKGGIKKRLGRSPDKADAYVLGLWGARNLSAESFEGSGRTDRWTPGSPMAA